MQETSYNEGIISLSGESIHKLKYIVILPYNCHSNEIECNINVWIWISLGLIQIKLSVADSLQNNFYKSFSHSFSQCEKEKQIYE